jgi:hypothetical protein
VSAPPPVSPSQALFVARLAGLVRRGGRVLDAAGGTAACVHALLAAGLQVTGLEEVGPEDLFDGLLAVDALAAVAPPDWPAYLAGFAVLLRPQAPAYLTVQLGTGPPPELPEWLEAVGFTVTEEVDDERYRHLLLTRVLSLGSGSALG